MENNRNEVIHELGEMAGTSDARKEVSSNEVAGSGEVTCVVSTSLNRKEDSDVNRRKQCHRPQVE